MKPRQAAKVTDEGTPPMSAGCYQLEPAIAVLVLELSGLGASQEALSMTIRYGHRS